MPTQYLLGPEERNGKLVVGYYARCRIQALDMAESLRSTEHLVEGNYAYRREEGRSRTIGIHYSASGRNLRTNIFIPKYKN